MSATEHDNATTCLQMVTVIARRCDGWWAIEVSEIPGLFTQVRRLDQVAAMVKDAAATLNVKVNGVKVTPKLSEQDELMLQRMLDAKSAAIKTQEEASMLMRETVRILRNQGLTVRDVAELTGVTPQRISLLKA
ncbi:XRE family transcriptional regulator [Gardnerella sp. Marseille-Q9181]|uniref:XRE family transcriptional regulator n=1 Tax=Gardnerella TaxID=2701 RepID=UPI003369F6CB